MQKILMALEGPDLSHDSLAFGIYLSRLTHSRITGIFLENQPESQLPIMKKMYDGTYIEWQVDEESKAWRQKLKDLEQGIAQFRAYYANHDIPTAVHRDKGVPIEEIIQETRYADLLVMDAAYGSTQSFEKTPTAFVQDVLAKAECPTVIAPASFDGIEEIVCAWDGSQSATLAIKLFAYLFPQLSDKKVTIVHVNDGDGSNAMARNSLQEWTEHHYHAVSWEELRGTADTTLFDYCLRKRKVFIVFGSFGRNAVSRFFRHSHAEKVIRTVTQPVFIAHI